MNKKKLLSLVLCFAILLSVLFLPGNPIIAESIAPVIYESPEPVTPPETDFTYERVSDDDADGIIITGYSGKETKIIIPETLDGLVVTEIYSYVFSKNENITYIKLPAGLLFLAGDTFRLCSSLQQIDVDENNPYFTSVDGVVYMKETKETSANFGKPVYLNIFPAGRGGSFTIPYGVTMIDSYAFSHCYNLREIKMYNTVTTIGAFAFSHCWNLEKVHLSSNLKIIRKEAFAHCEALKYIDLPASLINIGKDAFLGEIDSDDNKVYYFTNGIACAKDSYAYKYLLDQWLPESIIIKKDPTITDIDSGLSVLDPYRILPKEEIIDIVVTPVDITEINSLFPTRYSSAYAFDISFTLNGEDYVPNGELIFNFDEACDYAVPSATKVYKLENNKLVNVGGTAHLPFIGAKITSGGRFVVLANDDFSLKGDIDGDGTVTLFDVNAALYASTNTLYLTPEQKVTANVDNSQDGKITTEDARKILRLAGGMSIE